MGAQGCAATLIASEAEARVDFGKPIRCKNNYKRDFDVSQRKGFRSMLCNYLYDSGKTWGELESEVQQASEEVKRLAVAVASGMGSPECFLDKVRKAVDTVAAEFALEETRAAQAKLVVEIQFMTQEYYEMRKKTHAWYKVMRSHTARCMLRDYAGGLGQD